MNFQAPRAHEDAARVLAALLDEELVALGQLDELQAREQAMLVSGEATGLSELANAKYDMLTHLSERVERRQSLLRSLGGSMGPGAVRQALALGSGDDGRLVKLWNTADMRWRSLAARNVTNLTVARQHLDRVSRGLGVLRQAAGLSDTYARNGHLSRMPYGV